MTVVLKRRSKEALTWIFWKTIICPEKSEKCADEVRGTFSGTYRGARLDSRQHSGRE